MVQSGGYEQDQTAAEDDSLDGSRDDDSRTLKHFSRGKNKGVSREVPEDKNNFHIRS